MKNKIWFHVWHEKDPQANAAWGFCTDELLQFVLDAPREQSWIKGRQFSVAKAQLIEKGMHGVKVGTLKYFEK